MNEARIIRKYPNRRLYDTEISSYITLADVKKLVIDQVNIKVIDARTQEDITHNTLLQIIVEQEEKGPSLFSTDSLQNMIRSYGQSMHQVINKIFEQTVHFFYSQQSTEGYSWAKQDPTKIMTEMAQQNMVHWQEWLKSFSDQNIHVQSLDENDEELSNDLKDAG